MPAVLKTTHRLLAIATVTFAVFALTLAARALTITTASDLMSNQTVSAGSDHRIRFVTPTGASAGNTISLAFETGFNLASLTSPDDFDLAQGSTGTCSSATFTDKTLGTTPSGATWGVSVSGQVVTFTSGTDTIPSGRCIEIEIGQNATAGSAGLGRIVNPSTVGAYTITIGGTFSDTGVITAPIVGSGSIAISATVPSAGGNPGDQSPTAPVLSNIRNLNITETTADVLWDTDVAASSVVDYGPTTSYGATALGSGTTFNHAVQLTGLTAGTLYHYRVRSTASGAPESVSGDFTFTTTDTTPPVISNVTVADVTSTSVRVTWSTSEDADSRVDYGPTEPYAFSATSAVRTNAHSLTLTGLTPDTLYRYRVTSLDASSNAATSNELTFSTFDGSPPTLSVPTVDNITSTSARVNWTTDELSDSVVSYGPTTAYGFLALNGALIANHQLTLTGLAAGTEYHFIVSSKDTTGNTASSADQVFTTLPDATPPANVSALTAIGGNAYASLTWNNPTDPDFAGVRIVRKTGSYPTGSVDGTQIYQGTGTSALDVDLVNGVVYYYAAFAFDASNNFSSGALAYAITNDGTPPATVTGLTATPGDARVQLAWTNPPDTDLAQIRIVRRSGAYPTGPTDGTVVYAGLGTSHLDVGTANGTTFYYAVYSYDGSGNASSPAYASATPLVTTTPAICGNAACEVGETNASCPGDCLLPPPGAVCGNAACEAGETAVNCSQDCAITLDTPLPPVSAPVTPAVNRFNASMVQFYTAQRTIRLQQDSGGFYRVLAGQTLSVIIPDEAFKETPVEAILNFGTSSYILARTPDGRFYAADIQLASNASDVVGVIIARYADQSSDTSAFDLSIRAYGRVVSIRNGQKAPVENAIVRLERQNGEFVTWDGASYGQSNPIRTGPNGVYGLAVPEGIYRLIVDHPDHRSYASSPFDGSVAVVNFEVELIEVPPGLIEVIVPGAPITENIANVSRAIIGQTTYVTRIVQNEIIHDPRVEEAANQVVIPAAAAVTAGVVVSAVQVTTLVNYLYFVLTQPILLLARRRRKEYGTVYNALTKLPIDLAIVRLYRTNGKLVRTSVTDKQGRYAFLVDEGAYRIEISKQNLTFPSQYLAQRKEDGQFFDLYHGEEIVVGPSGAVLTPNIPVDPIEVVKSARRLVFEDIGRKLQNAFALASVLVTLAAYFFYRQPLLAAATAFQIALYLVFRRLARPKQPKNWGIIYDARSRKPVPFAIARIIETQYNKVLESRMADSRGRYNFLVGSNKYYVSVEKPGYENAKTKEIDLSGADKGGVVSLDIGLEPKGAS